MKTRHWLFLAMLLPFPALAQSAPRCPDLPVDGNLSWEVTEGEGFLYCKAMREADGMQAFSVMLRDKSPFRERFSLRAEKAVIDGHEVRWYRGDTALQPDAIVRETQIELDDDLFAHIVLRVETEEQRAESQRLAESLRFQGTWIGSN